VTGARWSIVRGAALCGWLAATVGGCLGLVLQAAQPAPIVPNTFGLGPGSMVAFVILGVTWATVGALLVVRRPDNVVGRYMILVGAGYSVSILAAVITFRAVAGGDVALTRTAAWWTVLLSSIGSLVLYLGFIFPTGRGQTPRWDAIGRAFLAAMTLVLAWLLTQPGPLHLFPGIDNPLPIGPDLRAVFGPAPARAVLAFSMLTAPLLVASVASRYRMGDRVQREQMKWAISAIAVSFAALLLTSVAAVAANGAPEAPLTAYALAGTMVPVAIGIAILRHHLYDIDRIVSRTIVYGVVTTLLFAVFVLVNLGLQDLLSGLTGNDAPRVAASTLVIAALFNPLRRLVQGAVDRRFHRAHAHAERAAAGFAGRLRNEADLDSVAAALRSTAEDVVEPSTAGVWLRGAGVRRMRTAEPGVRS
jgi:hypothetical protein